MQTNGVYYTGGGLLQNGKMQRTHMNPSYRGEEKDAENIWEIFCFLIKNRKRAI